LLPRSGIQTNLPTDFGFPIDVNSHEPETINVVPIKSDSLHYPPDGKLRVYRSKTGDGEWEPLTKGLSQKDCYVNVLRDAAVRTRLVHRRSGKATGGNGRYFLTGLFAWSFGFLIIAIRRSG
jgi:hypothetical protein